MPVVNQVPKAGQDEVVFGRNKTVNPGSTDRTDFTDDTDNSLLKKGIGA